MTYQAGHAANTARTLSDEYWMLSHHDYDGKQLVNDEVLETGLAGAVLAELLLAGRLDIIDKRVVVRDGRLTGNPLLDLIVSMVGSSPSQLSALKWIQNVRDAQYAAPERSGPITLTDAVGLRLAAAGMVEEQAVRGLDQARGSGRGQSHAAPPLATGGGVHCVPTASRSGQPSM